MRIALATILLTFPLAAQSFEQMTALSLHEAPMSARVAAMGGASDPLGDDAADLASNPALAAGTRRAFFSVSAAETGYGIQRLEFNPPTLSVHYDRRQRRSFAHAAAAIPIRGFVLGLYTREEPQLRNGNLDFAPGTAPYVPVCSVEGCTYALLLGVSDFERRERRHGVTAAFERGAFSFGAGAEMQDLDEQYVITRGTGTIPFTFRFERIVRRTSGTRIVPNAGVRWKVSPRIAVAAAYNGAATREQTDDVCTLSLFSDSCSSEVVPLSSSNVEGADAWRASASFVPFQRMVLTGEAVRRNYGKEANELVPSVGFGDDASSRDATELHAGAEYRLPGVPVSLRAGWWREPSKISSDPFRVQGDTIEHRTYGAGFDAGAVRIDVAYDDAEAPALRRTIVAISYRH